MADRETTYPTIGEIARHLEAWAPPPSAQSYDNVGLQVGDPSAPVRRAVLALDLTAGVVDEAEAQGAELIVTHHPLIFKPLRRLTPGAGPSGLAYRLARSGIALYSIHTNLDAAPEGVSFALAEQLGIVDARLLDPFAETLFKIVIFVPVDAAEAVRVAAAEAGAGRIGEYEAAAFATEGTGYFRPGPRARPAVGTAGGGLERVKEIRLEVVCSRWERDAVLAAVHAAHPYETPACDVYPVSQPSTRTGFGAVGRLPEAEPLSAFLQRVAERLDAGGLRYAGDPEAAVETVAVCGGSGSSLLGAARRAGADAFVTADVTYHTYFDVLGADGRPAMALVDAGHYETEAVTERLLLDRLGERFPEVAWQRTRERTSPMRTYP